MRGELDTGHYRALQRRHQYIDGLQAYVLDGFLLSAGAAAAGSLLRKRTY
ncbi:MAG: hypothetical protein J4400_05570 [Candidatus Aenigmarchaeota archaeon]|nr:hypothetical protein [Candidatus Aenigmarchaeota archaeon]